MKKPLTTAFRLWSTFASAAVLAFSAAGKPDDGAPPRAEASITDVEKGTPAGWRALLEHPGFNRAAVWSQWAAADPAACYEELRRQPGWQKPLPAPVVEFGTSASPIITFELPVAAMAMFSSSSSTMPIIQK